MLLYGEIAMSRNKPKQPAKTLMLNSKPNSMNPSRTRKKSPKPSSPLTNWSKDEMQQMFTPLSSIPLSIQHALLKNPSSSTNIKQGLTNPCKSDFFASWIYLIFSTEFKVQLSRWITTGEQPITP